MSIVQDTPSTAASGRTPQRILLVDDDELELELMADRLKSLGFETHTVSDGRAALDLLQTQSFPVVITDWQMPRMDGIRLTESLRNQGDSETYIVMLTVLDDDSSHERGYFAGVDDYLSKRAPDAKIVAAIRAGFRAVEMRQALQAVKQQQGGALVSDVASGVLADRMRAELKRATRYGRNLSIVALELHSQSGEPVAADTMARALRVVNDAIRVDIDFATRYRGLDGMQRIAVVLPETNAAAAAVVGARLSATVAARMLTPLESFTAPVGCASFTPGQEAEQSQPISASIEALLREAETAARGAPATAIAQRRSETV